MVGGIITSEDQWWLLQGRGGGEEGDEVWERGAGTRSRTALSHIPLGHACGCEGVPHWNVIINQMKCFHSYCVLTQS